MARHNHLICETNGDKKSQDLNLSTCIQLRVLKHHPSGKVVNFRHLLSCETIVFQILTIFWRGYSGTLFWIGGGGQKSPPHLNFEYKQDNEAKFGMKIPLFMKNSKT